MKFLREELGYKGVIITDDITMKAISQNYEKPYLRAFKAGFNLIMISNMKAAVKELKEALASGEITEEDIDKALLPTIAWKVKHMH
ncbi:MAG: hypothetical protein HUJ98_02585 [Bacteroidaceae bacterium]|nr:hypothetical protein [Bacteroidales bacterium]MCF0185358.1 hypothetical protein [Bacteroidaceae bacterium]